MTPENMILIAMGIPLLAVAWVAIFGKLPDVRETGSIAAAVATFTVCCLLASHVFAGARPTVLIGEMMPGFSISFTVEPLGMAFALIASGLWILTTIYAIGYMRGHHEINQTRFFCCFAIAIFAALAAAFSGNLFTLFVAYEVMTISTYPLVTHHGDEKARAGGRVYLGILLSTSVAFFMLAIVWTWHLAGTLDFTPGGILSLPYRGRQIETLGLAVLLGLFAYGIGKAALMPFHRWLPAAMVAPTPVSALLHAVAVVKVGVFSVLKIVVYIFGFDLVRESGISEWLCYVAGASILIGSLVAMTKDNLKARLAYSTISQLAYITLGAALATQASIIGSGMHIAMHAVGKITLFFCAGAIYVGAHKSNISDMRGLGRAMPFTFGAFLLASISIIGLPPGGGAWSKWFLAVGTADRGMYFLLATLMISSLLNIAYLVPIPIQAFMTPKGEEPQKFHEAPMMCVVPLCMTAVGSVLLFFFAQPIYDVLLPITEVVTEVTP
ncbi:proton-conducting transporter transmembrane domain-containing protein [Mariniblastus fucicola]|uniref:Na(+)/H(+) antiporter subunit D n=1 Tax=Mariniblastus fucicola TaxID=980251 RepID=A0A5B9PFA7_9BACT|nr:proton-conducting transporter membrane subunit [Mariniblastus fucicola]QEG24229.1 Na(+)/H(+) antiporter subunit D [Mariniblastus fucicola]